MLHHISQRQKVIVMLAVMSGLFLVALDQTIISTALGRIVEEFNSFSSLSWVVTAYMLTSTVTVPIAGKLSDLFGRRPVLMIGVALFTLASLLSGSSASIEQLIIFRAIQGVGAGIIMANAFTIVGDLFSPRERGKWQGLIGAVFGLSSVIGPLLGGFLTDPHNILGMTTNWRWTFWLNVPVGIASFLVISRYAPNIRHAAKHTIDYLGAGLLALALSSLILAVDNTDKIFSNLIASGVSLDVIRYSLYATFVLATGLFIAVERRVKQPIISLSFFKNQTFRTVMAVALLFGAAFLGAILYLTQFNQQVFGANATEAGLMLLPMIIGLSGSAALTGQLVTKTGKYKMFIFSGFVIATTAMFALTTLTPESPYWHEAVIMFFAGLGLGAGMPIINLAVQNEFEQKDLGAATSASQLFRGLGSTIGTAVLGTLLTTGVTSQIGNLQSDPYIQTLQKQPQSAQMLSKLDVDTALVLNMHDTKDKITSGLESGTSSLPAGVRENVVADFKAKQETYSQKIIHAFSSSLHNVFVTSGFLMLGATILTLGIKEKPLRGGHDDTPGVA